MAANLKQALLPLAATQPGAGPLRGAPPTPIGHAPQTPAPGLFYAPNSIAARVLAAIPDRGRGMQFSSIIAALPQIYWKTISAVLPQLVAAGLVERIESRTSTSRGVTYPHYTFRYRLKTERGK